MTKKVLKEVKVKADPNAYRQRESIYEDLEIEDGIFPLILYSHGYGSIAESNSDLCRHLAENGYIVASISHTYEELETRFSDGEIVPFDQKTYKKMTKPLIPAYLDLILMGKKKMTYEEAVKRFDSHQRKYEKYMVERAHQWLEDDRHILRFIHEMNEEEGSFLYRKIDFSHGVGATGHSFGGAAAYGHCLNDDEISCGVNMDGALFGDHGDKINHKPFMQMINKSNPHYVARALVCHDKPIHFLTFRDMTHMGFTDLKLLTDKKMLVGKLDAKVAMKAINDAHLSFFDRYLKNADSENREKLPIAEEALQSYEIL